MSGDIPLPLVTARGRRDYYTEYIEESRWLRREQAEARKVWFDELSLPQKDTVLFEFEMMLKGLVCFGNPINHPGSPKRGKSVALRGFKEELEVVRTIVESIITIGKRLSTGQENARVFQRYLESIIAQDEARFQMVKESLAQDMPAQSLSLLVSAFQNYNEILKGLSSVQSVHYNLFKSVIQMAEREIHRSTYFNPLAALEFRLEFDRIYPNALLEMVNGIASDSARKVAALTFLALFRLLSYLEKIDDVQKEGKDLGVLFSWLAVLRSDTRALTIFLKRDSATWVANGFGRLYEQLEPKLINAHFNDFELEFNSLRSQRKLLASIGDQMRLEQRKVFEQQLPSVESVGSLDEFGEATKAAIAPLRSFLQNTLVLLATEFDPSFDATEVFADFISVRSQSIRLRRDIWMFQQVLRAFIEKAKASASIADQWTGMDSFRFMREFVKYFRSMGYQLLRYSDYEQFDIFMALIDRLREGDVLEVQRFTHVVESCKDFQQFLEQTIKAVNQREELKDTPFDKKEAVRTLKLFLGR